MTKTNNKKTKFIKKLLKIYQSDDTDNISADIMRQFLNEIIKQDMFFKDDYWKQQDANEFMIILFDEIEKNNNIIDIFGFDNMTVNKCTNKNDDNIIIAENTGNVERTNILSLAITEYKTKNSLKELSISKLLDYYQRVEKLEGDNIWKCGFSESLGNGNYTNIWNSEGDININGNNYNKEERKK